MFSGSTEPSVNSWGFGKRVHSQGFSRRVSGPKINHDSHRRDRILRFFSPPGNRAIFSTFWGHFLTKSHIKPGEKGKDPMEKIQKKIRRRRVPRNCRFLSLVVAERVLRKFMLIQVRLKWIYLPPSSLLCAPYFVWKDKCLKVGDSISTSGPPPIMLTRRAAAPVKTNTDNDILAK